MKNEPAFPTDYTERVEVEGDHALMSGFVDRLVVHSGLTKREKFAEAAMQGLISNPNTSSGVSIIAIASVTMADALLAELEKQP